MDINVFTVAVGSTILSPSSDSLRHANVSGINRLFKRRSKGCIFVEVIGSSPSECVTKFTMRVQQETILFVF